MTSLRCGDNSLVRRGRLAEVGRLSGAEGRRLEIRGVETGRGFEETEARGSNESNGPGEVISL